MIVKINSAGLLGIDALSMEIEVDCAPGIACMLIVGLPDKSINEAKERVRSAIINSEYNFPNKRITVNLAPADIKKEGPAYDLPIAIGSLAGDGIINRERLSRTAIIGELALDGRIRPIKGSLPIALKLKEQGIPALMLPVENAEEAAVIDELDVIPVSHLTEAVGYLNNEIEIKPMEFSFENLCSKQSVEAHDFADVKGQDTAKRALEIAAAGGHNILMIGPPGSGKTMLSRRMPSILPGMSLGEMLEATKLHSVAGLTNREFPLVTVRPFRAPHHSISNAGLVGGSSHPKPGEVSLSHNGVLFLDELPEFNRHTLELLRQPLEDREVTISRASMSLTFPADFILITAMNPCPCGYRGHPTKVCKCSNRQIELYMNRISGPLLDRIDMHIEVGVVNYDELRSDIKLESSEDIRHRVQLGRKIQEKRFADTEHVNYSANTGIQAKIYNNSQMTEKAILEFCKLDEQSEKLLKAAMNSMSLSARAYNRILKLSRTIADLEQSEIILAHHIAEAVSYRVLDRGSMLY
ncbi:MAG: YifB family Mg chelatase-like AAA ATPase [Planctomycetes bacterium]|nr:YifB family Mg chelatase-like AAA ATPase [Planctomycetota bacterium]